MPWKKTFKSSEQVLFTNDKQKLEEKKQFTLIPYQSVEMTEGTPEVQQDKNLTLLTFDI